MTTVADIEKFYYELSQKDVLPSDHVKYLESLKQSGFEPKVIYDIGSCVLHWTRHAKRIWPDAEIVLFDANPYCIFLYEGGYKYYSGILSNVSNVDLKFYLNEFSPGGASYYREIGMPISAQLYSEDRYYTIKSKTLDDAVEQYQFPLPDLVKMDVQGAERDILQGGTKTMANARHLIMEIPNPSVEYNKNAPSGYDTIDLAASLGWTCTAPRFSVNGCFDADYGFERISYH